MSDISRALESLQEDFDSADKLENDIYNKYFGIYFIKEMDMYFKFHDGTKAITDAELEWVITSLPLDLFAASNALAQFKQHNEIVKLKIKQRKSDNAEGLDEEYRLMSIIYTSVITRVEQQISFSKEFIMGAKKVWDARRASETPLIGESIAKIELPEYKLDDTTDPKVNF